MANGMSATAAAAVAEQQILSEQASKQTLADWKDSAAQCVRQQLFDKKQFVTDKELAFGGNIQKLVCADINVSGDERALQFWNERGGRKRLGMHFVGRGRQHKTQ
jgi:hypothetical protein